MRKWLIGCGVAVGVALCLLVAGGMIIGSYVKKRMPDLRQVDALAKQLQERYGDPEAFVPPLDGGVPPDRIALFAAVRDSLAGPRARDAETLRFLIDAQREHAPERPTAEKIADKIGLMQGSFSFFGGLLDYFKHQQQVLLAADMGPGEYQYWLALTSFSWLQWDPLAVPEDVAVLRRMQLLSEVEEAPAVFGTTFRAQLENARRGLVALPQRNPAQEAWLKALGAELDRPRSTAGFPFADRLPAATLQALEPYRSRLQLALPRGPGEIALEVMRPSDESGGFQFGIGERNSRRRHSRGAAADSAAAGGGHR